MFIRKGYLFRLKVDNQIEERLKSFAGCARFIWNKALHLCLTRYQEKGKIFSYSVLNAELQQLKGLPDHSFLKEAHSQILQQSLKDLTTAWSRYFNPDLPSEMPVFKKKYRSHSFRYPQGFKLDNRRIYLPKIGWVGFYKSRPITGKIKNITVSQKSNHWYVSLQTEQEIVIPPSTSTTIVGIDVGVKTLATLSNGETYPPINSGKKYAVSLATLQRKLARLTKFSRNWQKIKRKIREVHHTLTQHRHDYLHKCSTTISKNHAVVFLEGLAVTNMTKSRKGTQEKPGKKVKAKSRLNRSILDQGWYEFGRQLTYKLLWNGGELIKVPPHHTSVTCLACRYVDKDNRQSQAMFKCLRCGFSGNADLVGAINILIRGIRLRAGHAQLACGELKLKQEPEGNCEIVPPHNYGNRLALAG